MDIFRIGGGVEEDPAVRAWFSAHPGELGDIAHEWFSVMCECGPDVRQLLHDGCPVACVRDAPFGYVNVFRTHVNVGFFRGSELPDPAHLLEGTGRHMRHVKIRPGVRIDSMALQALIEAAYRDIRERS